MESTLRKLQLEELAILKSVAKSMDENNIKYYLAYGTLLGAIRHNGFIPWDDDVDIFVPRNDYEKFKSLANDIMESPYRLNSYEKNDEDKLLNNFIKVVNPNLKIYQDKNGERIKQSVWIDIFPLDGLPKSKIQQKILFIYFRILYILLRLSRSSKIGVDSKKERPFIERIGIKMNKFLNLGKIINHDKVLSMFDEVRKRYAYDSSDEVYGLAMAYKEKCICKKEWFSCGQKKKFEDTLFNVPSDFNAVLTRFYGDYMKLPDKAQRNSLHIIGIVEE